jgi:thiamine biosynthesis lipoprotein
VGAGTAKLPASRALARRGGLWAGTFDAMASPCEVLVESPDRSLAGRLLEIASEEAWRIERKYSRYLLSGIVKTINDAGADPVEVDVETAGLLDFAAAAHEMSEGRFDITSGVLRRIWRFDGSDRVPSPEAIESIRPLVGWERATWRKPVLRLAPGMEIDLGGIGKEYAIDRAWGLLREASEGAAFLVNFGGDLRASGPRTDGEAWTVGIENPTAGERAIRILSLTDGALATSGDARRFLLRDGVRYPHILDPRTCRPVCDAPRSVTIAAATCTEAGLLATLAMLHGAGAERFLEAEGVRFWCLR